MAFTQNLAGGHLTSGLHSTPLNSLLRISIQMPYSISDSLCPKLKSPSIPSRLPKLSTTTTTLFQPYFASLSLSSPNGKPTLLPFIIHNHWSLCLINATFQTSHSEPLKVCWVLTLRCPLHTTPHTASRVDFLTDEMYIIPLLKKPSVAPHCPLASRKTRSSLLWALLYSPASNCPTSLHKAEFKSTRGPSLSAGSPQSPVMPVCSKGDLVHL